jgi:hypothetical protein
MPTLATGISVNNKLSCARAIVGLHAYEIMIVVFIIGVMTAAVVISFGGNPRHRART